VNNELENMRKEVAMASFIPRNFPVGTVENQERRRCPDPDSNRVLLEYKSRALPLEPTLLINP
jgi:hypothetical protein